MTDPNRAYGITGPAIGNPFRIGRIVAMAIGLTLAQSNPVVAQSLADLPAWAQERHPATRRALIIGIQDYAIVPDLDTPKADRNLVTARLKALGFTVIAPTPADLNREQMLAQIDEFLASLRPGDFALVYFSGHGMERDGTSYLVPSNASAPARGREGLELISLDFVLDELQLAGVGMAVVVLDACRTDPFSGNAMAPVIVLKGSQIGPAAPSSSAAPAGPAVAPQAQSFSATGTELSTLSETGEIADEGDQTAEVANIADSTGPDPTRLESEPSFGLAKVDTPHSVVIGYAAKAGQPAYSLQGNSDAPDRGSIYTRLLVDLLGRPGMSVQDDLAEAARQVSIKTKARQTPWIGSGGAPVFQLDPSPEFRRNEEAVWVLAASQLTPRFEASELSNYLLNYPASEFSFAARKRLFEIRQHTSPMDEGLATEYAADSFERLTGPLVNPGFSRSDQGLVGIVADDLVVYDAPAAFLRRREPLFQLSEGDEVEILSSNLSSRASSVMIGLADGRVGYIDRVRSETVPVQSATIVTFAGSDTDGDSPLTPTLDLDEQALALLRSARARIEINLGAGESSDNSAEENERRRLAYVRGLTLRQELIGLGAQTENIIVNVAGPGSQADSAEIRIGELRGPQ